eukprot:2740043-Rhodomonas_salina.1
MSREPEPEPDATAAGGDLDGQRRPGAGLGAGEGQDRLSAEFSPRERLSAEIRGPEIDLSAEVDGARS